VEAASAHNGAMVLSLQMNGEKCQERQSTGGGSQPAVAINRRPAVTVETVLPSATLQCVAVSNDSDRRKHKIQQVTEDE